MRSTMGDIFDVGSWFLCVQFLHLSRSGTGGSEIV